MPAIPVSLSGDLLEAMANAHRLQILTLLADTEINVADLSERMGLSQSALSQHLAKLRKASLVSTRRAAQTISGNSSPSGSGRNSFILASSQLLDAMSNASRLRILTTLVAREISVGELGPLMGLSQSALSQHLAKLRSAGIVSTRREAQTIYYSCASVAVIEILQFLSEFFSN